VSSESIEIVREAIAANRSGPPEETLERALAITHPEMEFLSRLSSIEGAIYRGHEGTRRYFADMADAWREWRLVLEALEELGSDQVYAQAMMHAVGQSGVAIELRSWLIVEVADEKVRRMNVYPTREEALAAAGTSR
jgi:hypothetical protein